MDFLKDAFIKFLPENAPPEKQDKLDPLWMKLIMERIGMDLSDPSMYQMACWMSVVNKQSKIDGITFDEFISQAIFFFS